MVGQPQRPPAPNLDQQMRHSVVGLLELTGEALELPGDNGLTLITYTVEPATTSAQALQFLATWASPKSERCRPRRRVARLIPAELSTRSNRR